MFNSWFNQLSFAVTVAKRKRNTVWTCEQIIISEKTQFLNIIDRFDEKYSKAMFLNVTYFLNALKMVRF